ncbi:MAG: sigma-54-dependent transcriptional regulator [Desulfonatronovibrio sp.]
MSKKELKDFIYIVDDEKRLLDSLFITLKTSGFENVAVFNDARKILGLIPLKDCRVMLLDLFMPEISGEEILEQVRIKCPHVQVVIITGVNETETAVRCIKNGAFDYLVKPVDPQRLITTVRRAMNHALLVAQNEQLRARLLSGRPDHPEYFQDIISNDPRMKSIFSYLEVIAPASDPVLITGETGTGKDLIASAIHRASRRKGRFISLNTAGLDDNIFSDTLFGHVRGAFTDAREPRRGLVEEAAQGTLFLDEIGDLSPASQVKLLNLTQDHVYRPLGSDRPQASSARIITATNRDLDSRMDLGKFRRDLYYRINTYHVHLPPLRERGDDIILLARYYIEKACAELNRQREEPCPNLAALLKSYDYPGNVRELRSLIFGSMARGGMEVLKEVLSERAGADFVSEDDKSFDPSQRQWTYPDPLPTLSQAVSLLIDQAMEKSGGNQSRAAGMLGISRQALNRRMKKP